MEEVVVTTGSDILVLPFFGQGHLFPCVELCKHLSNSHNNCSSILIIPSHLSSSIPSDLHSSIRLLTIPASYTSPPPELPKSGPQPPPGHHQELGNGIESFLSETYKNGPGPARARPLCVVMDVMMSWSKEIFQRHEIPIVSFITSGACATAMEHAAWKAHVDDLGPGETRFLPGLPESVSLITYSDLKRKERGPGRRGGGGGGGRPGGMNFGPPKPGQRPRWTDEVQGSSALLINTSDNLEGPFLEYLSGQVGKPVLGIGPLLPDSYWKSSGSILRDRDSRPKRESNYTEDEVIQWLDSKPSRSVVYVSFGSEVGPTLEEYGQLADALGESGRSFVWVIQPGSGKIGPPLNFFGGPSSKDEGYYPYGLEEKVKERGLIIKGWAPQLLILSHPSTGGFLSHCGWNSTVEALGRGVPILVWPIRGDQFYNAKLVANYLKVGHVVSGGGGDLSETVKKCDVMRGIELLMGDGEVLDRAMALRGAFEGGYPSSSDASLKALIELMN